MTNYDSDSIKIAQTMEDPIDPGFTYPDTDLVMPDDDLDPDFSVMPPYYPDYPVRPDFPPFYPVPGPCIFCNNNQWINGGIRFLNAATAYNAFTVSIDNRPVFSNLEFAQITQYRRISQGYHTFTIMGSNGYVYLRKSMYVGDGMATIAIINSSTGLDLASIADTACPTTNTTSCFRVCNLAYYSGPVNVSIGNLYFNSVNFNQAASFSRLGSGNYTIRVARSARPGNTLLTTAVQLNPNRIYTLYVLNWNPSSDTIQTFLVEDRRS